MIVYKYRMYPNKEQQKLLWEDANKLNWLYNFFLDQKITIYKSEKRSVSKFEQQNQLPKMKREDPFLKRIHSQVVQTVAIRLDEAYKRFFERGNFGFPKFRSCRKFFGIHYSQSGYTITDKVFKTKAYGKIPIVIHREIKGNIKNVHITTKYGEWYLCVCTDHDRRKERKNNKGLEIGIDVGVKDLVVTSDGEHIKNCTHASYFDKQIAKVQSRADKKKKGSRSYKFLRGVKRRLYDAKIRKISDFQHKVSHRLSSKYDTIYAENLNAKKMSESDWTSLNKSLRNSSLATFLQLLSYKTNNLRLVNPYNTSKTCNSCGYVNKELTLKERTVTCSNCGCTYDRDENAAKNIHCLGQATLALAPKRAAMVTLQEALLFRGE